MYFRILHDEASSELSYLLADLDARCACAGCCARISTMRRLPQEAALLLGLGAPAVPEALWDSVTQRIFTLPDETLLFAGHERHARAVSTVLEQQRSGIHSLPASRATPIWPAWPCCRPPGSGIHARKIHETLYTQ